MKAIKITYYIGAVCSALVGIWHFFVPKLYGWADYIPKEYSNLTVLIDWINLLFSLFLSGLSILLILWGKRVFFGNKEAVTLFGFMTFVWVFRVAIAIIEPYPVSALPWAAYGQLIGCAAIMLLSVVPFVYSVSKTVRNSENKNSDNSKIRMHTNA